MMSFHSVNQPKMHYLHYITLKMSPNNFTQPGNPQHNTSMFQQMLCVSLYITHMKFRLGRYIKVTSKFV